MKYSSEVIGKNIADERKKHKMTQAELGAKINISGKQVSNYEKGKLIPPIDILLKLCEKEIFDCELGYLLGEDSYTERTALETQIHKLTGLSEKSMNVIRYITGDERDCMEFGYFSVEYRKILNVFLSSNSFINLIEKMNQLDKYYNEGDSNLKQLENKIGTTRFQAAKEHFLDEWDYENDPNAPQLSLEEIEDMVLFEEIITDKQRELDFKIKIARYMVNDAFGNLIRELYPEDYS